MLEIGIGTGLTLPYYKQELQITGIDLSDEMLTKARSRVSRMKSRPSLELHQMDAEVLNFPNNTFDVVTAMHVFSAVPAPLKVMVEVTRVLQPGGKMVITNQLVGSQGALTFLAKILAPLANLIGWHSNFRIETFLQ